MDKFVTLAVHSYDKAQNLMHILNNEGIEAYTEDVNHILPTISVGVRVRVKEEDLDRALKVYEDIEKNAGSRNVSSEKTILVPYDFEEFSYKIFPLAFSWAKSLGATVVLFHTFLSKVPSRQSLLDRIFEGNREDFQKKREEELRAEKEMQKIAEAMVQNMIAEGVLENVPYVFKSNEGVPEEQIINYAEDYKPLLIAMSTRSCERKQNEMIGSVSAEVAEGAPIPVFVLPEDKEINDVADLDKIAFVTNFEDKDLQAFDKMMTRLSFQKESVHFVHASRDDQNDAWSEIKLEGIKSIFREKYNVKGVEYAKLHRGNKGQEMKEYLKTNEINIVALSIHRRSAIARLWGDGIARKMVNDAKLGMFVFHA